MKRIVNGVTYDTNTATKLACLEGNAGDDDQDQYRDTLYQTRGGAYFVHEWQKRYIWNAREREHEERESNAFTPMSAAEAQRWIVNGNGVEVFHNPFEEPPEATAEAEPGATLFIRVPASLKSRVDQAASDAKLSGNAWAMRCLEECMKELPKEIALIWSIAASFRAHAEDGDWSRETCIKALVEIADYVEEFAEDKFGEKSLSDVAFTFEDECKEVGEKYAPFSS